jgi:serine/threonine protein kinase
MLQAISSKRFRVLRRLGEGGMGEVYEAIDGERDERIALKMLRSTTADALVRFKREFRALQDIHHPNLVSLGELVSEGDRWFFSMELVHGVDFVEYVREPDLPPPTSAPTSPSAMAFAETLSDTMSAPAMRGGFDEGRLRASLLQVTHALVVLHNEGKVHRDVKPSNVLVTGEGRVVVLDFGLVTEALGEEQLGTTTEVAVVGTPAYMAPEQAASRPVTAAADWYAVGVLLYESLTGTTPFHGAPLEILLAKQKNEPPPPSAVVPDVPPDLDELCAHLLRFDPATRAGPQEILRVLEGAPARGLRTTGQATQFATFVGRDAELQALRDAFADARSKRGVSVLIHGESGIGKSWAVRHFTEETSLRERDLVVLAGRCFERESVPYKAFDGVVDALSRFMSRLPHGEALALLPTRPASLAQLFPVLKRVEAVAQSPQLRQEVLDPQELRSRAFASLREVFTRLADRRPVIVTIDDLQWADADSIALLEEIMRPPDAPNLLLVATLREGSAETTSVQRNVHDLSRRLSGEVRHLHLGPLSKEHSRTLARALIERSAPELPVSVDTIASEAAGHPLFIDEIVRHLVHVGAPATAALRLDEALWSRVEALEDRARKLVELAAVAGTPIAQDAMTVALDVAPADFTKLTSFLRVAHLVKTSGSRGSDTIETYHSRVRSAVLAKMKLPELRAHHRRLAVALESSGSNDEEAMAAHWEGAGVRDNAAKHMLKAAEHAQEALAFDRAAKMYERALTLRSESKNRSDREAERAIERKWADALAMAGRGALAAKAYRSAAVGANAAEALDLRRRAAEHLLRSGHFDEGLIAVRHVLTSVGLSFPETPMRALLLILVLRTYLFFRGLDFRERDASDLSARDLTRVDVCWSVAVSLSLVDPIRGALFQERHLLLSLRAREPYRVARALALCTSVHGMKGTSAIKKTRAIAARAQGVATRSGSPHALAWVKASMGLSFYIMGLFREALDSLREAEVIFRNEVLGSAWEIFPVRLFTLQSLAMLGRMKELGQEQPLTLREAIDRGDRYGAVNARIGMSNLVWLMAGEPEMARRQCQEAVREWSTQGFHLEHYYALMALMHVDLYEGKPRAALDRWNAEWRAIERSLITRVQFVKITCYQLRGRAMLATVADTRGAEREAVLRDVLRDARRIDRENAPWAAGNASLLRAGVQAQRGDAEGAKSQLERAVAELEQHGMLLHANVARIALAPRLGGDAGKEMSEATSTWMREQTIQKPARLVRVFAPGLET